MPHLRGEGVSCHCFKERGRGGRREWERRKQKEGRVTRSRDRKEEREGEK